MNTSMLPAVDIGVWYERYATQLRRVTRRIVGNAADAEDATQEAFVAAFRSRAAYRDGGDPYRWLYRIATRKALDIAAARRELALPPADAPGAVRSAEDEALGALEAQTIARALHDEPAVELHLAGGLRFREISDVLGIPRATAATHVRRGKLRLRRRLEATFTVLPESKPA